AQTVNKTFNMRGATLNEFRWEIFSGYVDYKKRIKNRDNGYRTSNSDNTWLVGGAGTVTLGVFSGLNLQASTYAFDDLSVLETNANLQLSENISTSWQSLFANDGSDRNIITASYSLPKGFGSLWVNKEKGNIKDDFPIYDSDNYSFPVFNVITTITKVALTKNTSHWISHYHSQHGLVPAFLLVMVMCVASYLHRKALKIRLFATQVYRYQPYYTIKTVLTVISLSVVTALLIPNTVLVR
ncbi:hypothetical protein OSB94_18010, partial [Proteus vulgaris]|nr:hypothetical protein [Proteus vulgaris]